MSNLTSQQEDRLAGTVSAPIRLAVIDGIPGWVICTYLADGTTWAYAPMWYQHLYGEIARQI